mgnify:CR=1
MARSFLSRLTGTDDRSGDFFPHHDADTVALEGEGEERHARVPLRSGSGGNSGANKQWPAEDAGGELAVDVYQNPDAIVVKAFIAGVQPNSIDISITREMITISGSRHDEREVEEDDYFQRELYWGSFSRTIILPEEIDVDLAEASEKHGILAVRLPKINKKKEMKLKVRSR